MHRPAYTHRNGQVCLVTVKGEERPMSPTVIKAMLESHRDGARNLSLGPAPARVSAELADQLERAIEAAAIFNRLSAARGKTSTGVAISKGSAA